MMFKQWKWLDWLLLVCSVLFWAIWLTVVNQQYVHDLVVQAAWGDVFSIINFLGSIVPSAVLLFRIIERRKAEKKRVQSEIEYQQEIDLMLTLRVAASQNLQTATNTLAGVGFSISEDGVITVPDIFWIIRDSSCWKILAEAIIAIGKHYVRVHNQDEQKRLLCAQAIEKLLLGSHHSGSPLWLSKKISYIFAHVVRRMEGYLLWPKDHPLA